MGTFIILILLVVFVSNSMKSKPLTTEQKLEDFDYLYNTLLEHQPMLEEYQKVIGFDFVGNKDYYNELIKNTKDDYEFYVMMEMIMEDFPSAHTSLTIESTDDIKKSGHTYSNEVKETAWLEERSEDWEAYESKYILEEIGETRFHYYDGQYISSQCWIAKQPEQTLILLSIDGEPIDEYICQREVTGKMAYDKHNNKVYRASIGLNLRYGQLVEAEFQNRDGDVFKREVYIRNKGCAFEGERIAPFEIPEVDRPAISEIEITDIEYINTDGPLRAVSDKERNLSYVFITSFNEDDIDGKLVSNVIQKACENDNIILDLRINEGGRREFFLEHIYCYLYKEDISIVGEYYVNQETIDNKLDVGIMKRQHVLSSVEERMESSVKLKYECQGKGNGVKDKKVYVLISDTTFSAADWAAAMLKEQTSAILVGTDTSGEGLGGTAFFDIMPNSKLTFMVQDSQSFNADGTDNSIYGTSPDIYISHTMESIERRNELINNQISYIDYGSRLKWDNILLETIKLINKTETN